MSATTSSQTNSHESLGKILGSIALNTCISFTACVLCWAMFWAFPNWSGTGLIEGAKVVSAVWTSLAICACMSLLGFLCFSDAIVKRLNTTVRCVLFGVCGYIVIAGWVFGTGWCPITGLPLFSLICVGALVLSCVITVVATKADERRLNESLDSYRRE